jgi:hypothetical protein
MLCVRSDSKHIFSHQISEALLDKSAVRV